MSCAKSQISICDLVPFIFPRGQSGMYMVIGFYADDSTDQPEQRIQTAGAVFGWPADIFEAERLWNQRLEAARINYFKASECETLNGEFAPKRLDMSLNSSRAFADATRREMVAVLERIPLAAVAVSLALRDFKEVISTNPKARYYYGTDSTILVYGRLIKATIELIHQDMPALAGIGMAFEFDDHADYLKAEAAYASLKRKDSQCAAVMGHVGHSDDKIHAPLQMADLVAHEARTRLRRLWLNLLPIAQLSSSSLKPILSTTLAQWVRMNCSEEFETFPILPLMGVRTNTNGP